MSTSTVLDSIRENIMRFGGPILMSIGTVSCILNLLVFTKNTLRKNPCAICFIAININALLFLYSSLSFTLLASGYDIDLSSKNLVFCRFRFYIGAVLPACESTYLILAAIDRTLITSSNARIRRLSTRRLMITCIIGIALFWIVFHIHALIFMEILQYGPDYFVCFYQPGAYTTFMTYYSLVINGAIPPVLMTIFGCWTIKNVRSVRHTPRQLATGNTSTGVIGRPYALQSKDQQLIRMLLMDIITYLICKSPVGIFNTYLQITQYTKKTVEQQMIEQSVVQLTYFVFFIGSSISCYTNILVSKTYRIELKRIPAMCHRFCFGQVN